MNENNKSYDEKLNNCIKELKNLYKISPKRAVKEIEKFNRDLKSIILSKQPTQLEKERNFKILEILSIIILFEGVLFNLISQNHYTSIIIYICGFLFFIAGHFVGMHEKGFGIIFLFSHSVTGMFLMNFSFIMKKIDSPIMTDLPQIAHYYLFITLLVFIIATIYVIVFNLSERVKKIKYSNFIPLIIYIIGFAMTGLFNIIILHIY